MMRAIQLSGPVKNAKDLAQCLVNIARPKKIGPGEVLVRNEFAGVNFIDTYHRTGLYPRVAPFTLGVEGAGQVVEIGESVEPSLLEQRVAYYGLESYSEFSVVKADQCVTIPNQISTMDALACITQGMTAHYLTHSTFPLKEGDTCLIHAAAGGTGQLLVQLAKLRGARVIGTASKQKLDIGRSLGADLMLPYNEMSPEEIVKQVKEATDGKGVHVVYDGVGASTFQLSLNSLRPRGMCVLFGNASGPVPPIDPLQLTGRGSLYLTRPKLYDYLETNEEFTWRMTDLFEWIAQGKLKINIQKTFPLEQASEAHEFLESGKTSGKVLLSINPHPKL